MGIAVGDHVHCNRSTEEDAHFGRMCGGTEDAYRFLSPTRMLRSGRSLESAVAVEPPTRPAPPSTSTRALEDLFLLVASAEGAADEVATAAGGAHALTTATVVAILPVARGNACGLSAKL